MGVNKMPGCSALDPGNDTQAVLRSWLMGRIFQVGPLLICTLQRLLCLLCFALSCTKTKHKSWAVLAFFLPRYKSVVLGTCTHSQFFSCYHFPFLSLLLFLSFSCNKSWWIFSCSVLTILFPFSPYANDRDTTLFFKWETKPAPWTLTEPSKLGDPRWQVTFNEEQLLEYEVWRVKCHLRVWEYICLQPYALLH